MSGKGMTTRVPGVRPREVQVLEIAVEHALGVPFDDLLAYAEQTGRCSEEDLLNMGRKIRDDLVRLGRGEISGIRIPRRLPRPGEFSGMT